MSDDPLPCTERPELFFAERPDQIADAKRLCGRCPEQPACLAGARERHEPVGVWGGHLFVGGRPVPWKRATGSPTRQARAAWDLALEALR